MIGTKIHSYTIQKKLGEGGMATVYLAQNKLGKKKAIKVLKTEYFHNEQVRKRFVQEAHVMAKLKHANICAVDDLEDNDSFYAIIMDYLEGQDLKKYVQSNGPVSEQQAWAWLKQIAPALDYAHEQKIVHRDIKPSNLFLTSDGQVKIMDFGIAKANNTFVTTHTDTRMGSLLYSSPEQIKSPKYVDRRSDIYSLGVTLHYLLSGKTPYNVTTESEYDVMQKVVEIPLESLNVSPKMNSIIKMMTQKDREQRPEKLADLFLIEDGTVPDTGQGNGHDETALEEPNSSGKKKTGDETKLENEDDRLRQTIPQRSGTTTIHGQTYKTIKIGNQIWMAENLNIEIEGTWLNKSKYCCFYDKDPENGQKYGRLYTWEAAKKNSRPNTRLAPPHRRGMGRTLRGFGGN